jgi:NTP pyrophosphatase (non-canonical NTP hydrolase)
MPNRDEAFVAAVKEELGAARAKFPGNDCVMIALTEEVGELAKALLDESWERVMEEATQVAVMAQRLAVEGDASAISYRSRQGLAA